MHWLKVVGNQENLRQKMDEGDLIVNVEVLDFLKEWLTYHILISDKASDHFFSVFIGFFSTLIKNVFLMSLIL